MVAVLSVVVPVAAGLFCALWSHRPKGEPRWKREYAAYKKVAADTEAANAQIDISTWR